MLVYFLNFFEILPVSILYTVLMKERPPLWKFVLWSIGGVFINTQLKPLLLGLGMSISMNTLVNIIYWVYLSIPVFSFFHKPLYYSILTGIYVLAVFLSFQFFTYLILLFLSIWFDLGNQFLIIAEMMYYLVLLSVEIIRPEWLFLPHHRLQDFVSQRPSIQMIVDIFVLILFFIFTTSFGYEIIKESSKISNHVSMIMTFSLLFSLAFIVLLKMIVTSHLRTNAQKGTLQVNEIVSTIDQMIYQKQDKSMILASLCDGMKKLYPEATACEVYEVKDENQLIAMGSSRVIALDDTYCYREADSGRHSILLSGRDESEKASYPEIKTEDRSMIHLPLILDGELYALLLISSKNQDAFDDDSLTLAQNLKDQLEQVMEKHRAYREAIHASIHDEITGLFNRRHTEELILKQMSDHDGEDQRFALVLLTLLGLERIQSDYGGEQAEKHLKEFAGFLKENAKESQLIGRHSENEFILILPLADRIAVDEYMNTIKKHLNDVPFELMKPHFHYGVSFYPDTARSLTRLISAADQQIVVSQRLKESMEMI